jgi:hypothetical protein
MELRKKTEYVRRKRVGSARPADRGAAAALPLRIAGAALHALHATNRPL